MCWGIFCATQPCANSSRVIANSGNLLVVTATSTLIFMVREPHAPWCVASLIVYHRQIVLCPGEKGDVLGHVLCKPAMCKHFQSNRKLRKSSDSHVSVDFHGSNATCSLVRGKSDCLPPPKDFLSWGEGKCAGAYAVQPSHMHGNTQKKIPRPQKHCISI